MKLGKRTILFVMSVLLNAGAWAQNMTEQEAAERALQFLRERGSASRAKVMGDAPSQPVLKVAKVEAEKVYAFNVEGGGYVIASGDSRTLPVLGYSDSGSIDWDQMPENMRAWLKQYDDAIATLGERTDFVDGNLVTAESEQPVVRRAARVAIEPLIKTRWDQDKSPYNDMCPLYAGHNPEWQGQRCTVGCVAVALAQILNYWQWPKSLPGGLPAYEVEDETYDENYTWHIDALPPVTFDWENMLDEYAPYNNLTNTYGLLGTEVQQQAVATLMRYCSQAIESRYSPAGTGGNYFYSRNVFVNHFGYAAATYVRPRQLFGIDEWETMVYAELAARRPLMYAGESPSGPGHAFVCDGYDGNGLFHFNWGWQGRFDGYYSLSVLNPYASTNPNKGCELLGFTQRQEMLIGLDPSLEELNNPLSDKPELWQYMKTTTLSENTVKFYFLYINDAAKTATVDYALGTIEADGTLTPRFIGDPNDNIVHSAIGSRSDFNGKLVEIDSTAFQPGETLRLHPMLRFHDTPEAEWQLIPPDNIYIDAGRREDGTFFITNEPYPLEYVSADITSGKGRLGGKNDVTVTIRNNGLTDYIGDIWLSAEDNKSINGAYLRAGQESEVTFLFTPTHVGQVSFDLYTGDEAHFGSFTMEFDPTAIKGS